MAEAKASRIPALACVRLLFFSLVSLLVLFTSLYAEAPSFAVRVSEPEIVMTSEQRLATGLHAFPDGSPSVWWHDGKYYFFVAGSFKYRRSGTIRLSGSLDHPTPDPVDKRGLPIPALWAGLLQHAPGSNFDRDYAGGGPVYYDEASNLLLHVYHGEIHVDPKKQSTFYVSLGLAISRDMGKTFRKLGMIVKPNAPRERKSVPSSCGSLVQRGEYLYLYYPDTDAASDGPPVVAVARVKIEDAISAAKKDEAAPWKKYHKGRFAQPGIGGKFTPLFEAPRSQWARWPVVGFDRYTQSYLMVYPAGTEGIQLRESKDGLKWSDPLTLLATPPAPKLNYTGIASATKTPGILEKEFFVYYTSGFYPHTPFWKTATWNRIRVTLERKPAG